MSIKTKESAKAQSIQFQGNPLGYENREVKFDAEIAPVVPVIEGYETLDYFVQPTTVLESFVKAFMNELEVVYLNADTINSVYGATETETLEYFSELLRARCEYARSRKGLGSTIKGISDSVKLLAPAFIQHLLSSVGVVDLDKLGVSLAPVYRGSTEMEPFTAEWQDFMTRMSTKMRKISSRIEVYEGSRSPLGNEDVLSFVWKSSKLYNQIADAHPITVLLASMLKTENSELFRPSMARIYYGDEGLFKHYVQDPRLVRRSGKDGR